MKQRNVKRYVRGASAVDGAGVHLTRIIGHSDVRDFDPFLMLDSFDSKNPNDYIKGFPMHPHRGIETVTYLVHGEMEHQDSLGNKGVIQDGQSQWMNSGSGIMHQEMPVATNHMLGFQLWINLPQKDKTSHPTYLDIKDDMIKVVEKDNATIRVIAGEYEDVQAVKPDYVDARLYDISIKANSSIDIETRPEDNVFVFIMQNELKFKGEVIPEKTAVLFDEGDSIHIDSHNHDARFIVFAGKPLKEGIAWGGPIVMNTQEELNFAFEELSKGTFIKHNAKE